MNNNKKVLTSHLSPIDEFLVRLAPLAASTKRNFSHGTGDIKFCQILTPESKSPTFKKII